MQEKQSIRATDCISMDVLGTSCSILMPDVSLSSGRVSEKDHLILAELETGVSSAVLKK